MNALIEALERRITEDRTQLAKLAGIGDATRVGEVSLAQLLGGARGVHMLHCDTSEVDPNSGVTYRGRPIAKLVDCKPEEVIWLLLTGELPSEQQRNQLNGELCRRSVLPEQVGWSIDNFGSDANPMVLFNIGVHGLLLTKGSAYDRALAAGVDKNELWKSALEDYLDLLAMLPRLAAFIYRRAEEDEGADELPDYEQEVNWGANLALLLGRQEAADLLRLYMVLHADHEGGNASAHTGLLVGSTQANLYQSFAAGMDALAGPRHGKANENCLNWIQQLVESCGGAPTVAQAAAFITEWLESGRAVPGYGHAVLRQPDPRFSAQLEWGRHNGIDSALFQAVDQVFQVAPGILGEWAGGKVKNPFPNVDAVSGSLLSHFGITNTAAYPMLFGVSRAIGIGAQFVHAVARGAPIERPKSRSIVSLRKQFQTFLKD